MSKPLTPLKAIRKKCVDCSGGELKEVRNCQFAGCPLYPLRMGRGSKATLKRIRAFCVWCCCGQRNEARLCLTVRCSLWEFRFGKKRPQIGGLLPEISTTEGALETEKVSKV